MKKMRDIKEFTGRYYYLSNYYDPCPMVYGGITYSNSESAYQAQKCKYPTDRYMFIGIDPDRAKMLGKIVAIRDDWDAERVFVMRDVIREKFRQHPELAELLISTGDAELVEGNTWHDNFFGDCRCPECRLTPGRNYLGRLLMLERKRLKGMKVRKRK